MTWAPLVPEGDRIEDHYHTDPRCRQPWEWCRCPVEETDND